MFEEEKRDFMKAVKSVMEQQLGEVYEDSQGTLKSFMTGLGQYDSNAVVEMSWMPMEEYCVLQIYTTLVQNVEEDIVPKMQECLWNLNKLILLGQFGYISKYHQIYHQIRLPISIHYWEVALNQVRFCLRQLRKELEAYQDYLLIIADNPDIVSLEEYLGAVIVDEESLRKQKERLKL